TLTSSANPSLVNQSVTLTAHVSAASGLPTGLVQFSIADSTTNPPFIVSEPLRGGDAVFSTGFGKDDTYTITATYLGDAAFAGSTSDTLSQVVTKAPTTTALSASANPARVLEQVVFTAQVSVSPATIHPTGQVQFTIVDTSGANAPVTIPQ